MLIEDPWYSNVYLLFPTGSQIIKSWEIMPRVLKRGWLQHWCLRDSEPCGGLNELSLQLRGFNPRSLLVVLFGEVVRALRWRASCWRKCVTGAGLWRFTALSTSSFNCFLCECGGDVISHLPASAFMPFLVVMENGPLKPQAELDSSQIAFGHGIKLQQQRQHHI